MELRQARERLAKLASRKYECDLLRDEATGHEGQDPGGRAVEPLRVVDGTRNCLLLGGFSEKAKDCEANQESIRRGPGPESERDVKRIVLGLRQSLPEVQEGRAELLHRREWELYLSLDPGRPGDPKLRSSLDRVLEHCGLTDTRLAVQHQHAATPGARSVQQPVNRLALVFPAQQGPSGAENRWRRSPHAG
jgi:hypothetical protein